MSEIIREGAENKILIERLKKSIGKIAEIFLKDNNYRYFGIIEGVDDKYLELFDFKINGYKIIILEQIKEVEVK
jgi:hypothetical protein